MLTLGTQPKLCPLPMWTFVSTIWKTETKSGFRLQHQLYGHEIYRETANKASTSCSWTGFRRGWLSEFGWSHNFGSSHFQSTCRLAATTGCELNSMLELSIPGIIVVTISGWDLGCLQFPRSVTVLSLDSELQILLVSMGDGLSGCCSGTKTLITKL